MSLIYLPHKVKLRPYQQEPWNAFFREKKDRFCLVWHRRAGKDKFCINLLVAASQLRVGLYLYLFPQLNQAKTNIWRGVGDDGVRFLDHFPEHLIKKVDNQEMTIEFWNGSLFKLGGSNYYNKYRGSNPLGIVFSEFSFSNPLAWTALSPVLAQNQGWALFNYTPYGTNHGYELYQSVKDNQDWHTAYLTVDDTEKVPGIPVITHEDIQKERDAGLTSEDEIQREYFCSWTTAVKGAYFTRQLAQAETQDRIRDFPIDPGLPVDTYWDLGTDTTAIWFVQTIYNEVRCINYYENQGESINHYINEVLKFRDANGLVLGKHYGPHDVENRHISTGMSTKDMAAKLGFYFIRIPRIADKQIAIEMARQIFPRVWFHKTNCKHGLSCLREYRKSYNEAMQVYSSTPLHNWASHGADAFMTLAQAWRQNVDGHGKPPVQKLDWKI